MFFVWSINTLFLINRYFVLKSPICIILFNCLIFGLGYTESTTSVPTYGVNNENQVNIVYRVLCIIEILLWNQLVEIGLVLNSTIYQVLRRIVDILPKKVI